MECDERHGVPTGLRREVTDTRAQAAGMKHCCITDGDFHGPIPATSHHAANRLFLLCSAAAAAAAAVDAASAASEAATKLRFNAESWAEHTWLAAQFTARCSPGSLVYSLRQRSAVNQSRDYTPR